MALSNDLSTFAPTDIQRGEILATVQGVFDALGGDAAKLSAVMMPDVTMRSNSVEEDGTVTSSTSTVEGLKRSDHLEWIYNGRTYVRFESHGKRADRNRLDPLRFLHRGGIQSLWYRCCYPAPHSGRLADHVT